MNEQWKDIKGYEGIYQVSNLGNVKSVTRTIEMSNGGIKTQIGRTLKMTTCGSGYNKVNLYDNNRKQRTWRIHTLVASHFINNPKGFNFVNHINENKLDDSVNNLFWTNNLANNSRGAGIGHKIRKGRVA